MCKKWGRELNDYIYLDNAATTYPKPESVYQRMDECNRDLAVNAGRGSYAAAREALDLIELTRSRLLSLSGANGIAEVVITPSATVACNEIIGGLSFTEYDVVYVSPYEHNAVARTLFLHQKRVGFTVEELPLCEDGTVDMELTAYRFSMRKPSYVFLTHVSNVTGYIVPVEEIVHLAKECGAVTVVDGSQAFGLVPVDLKKLKADYYVFAGHKNLQGPFGIGGFFMRYGNRLQPYIAGGTGSDSLNLAMPQGIVGLEAASPNIVAIAGLEAALKVYGEQKCEQFFEQEIQLTMLLREKLSKLEKVVTYLPPKESHVGMVACNVKGYQAADVGELLDEEYRIAVRTGYHCAPFVHKHLQDEAYGGVVRVSVGRYSTVEDVERLVEAVWEIGEG